MELFIEKTNSHDKVEIVTDSFFNPFCLFRYMFGFNGQEKVNEWAGIGNFMDYKARGQDTRVARFISLDPLAHKFPMLTPFQFASNTPIWAIDLDGKEGVVSHVSQWTNSSGEVLTSVTDEHNTQSYAKQYGNSGALVVFSDLDKGTQEEIFFEDFVITGTRPDKRSFFEKSDEYFNDLGNAAGNKIQNSAFARKFSKFDGFMKTASEVGVKLDIGAKFGMDGYNGTIGIYSTDENNMGFFASGNYTKDVGVNLSSTSGFSGTGKGGSSDGLPLTIKLSFYATHSSTPSESGVKLTNKTQSYKTKGLGPVSYQTSENEGSITDQISIGLDKKSSNKKDVSYGTGIKNVTEVKAKTETINLGQ